MTRARVAVVGGGIGGAALALALVHRGVPVAVYERRAAVQTTGSGLGLAPNGRRVLAELGLDSALRAAGAPIPVMRIRTRDGVETARYDIGPGGLLGVRRADLVSILVEALPPGVVQHDRDCVAVEPGARGTRLLFADGSAAEADVVVAADGVGSRCARIVADPPPLRASGTSALRGFVDGRGLPDELRLEQNAWLGAGRHLVTYPVDGAGTLTFAAFGPRPPGAAAGIPRRCARPARGWSARADPDLLRSAHAGWAPEVRALLARVEEVYRWDLADRDPFTPWTRGRVALLGDAAHPMLPHMGQGANQALEDAVVLAALLAGVDDDRDALPGALSAYEAERRPRTMRVQEQSRRNGERFSGRASGRSGSAASGDLSWVHAYDAVAVGRSLVASLSV